MFDVATDMTPRTILLLLLDASLARIAQPRGRTGCPEGLDIFLVKVTTDGISGYILWQEDLSCHRSFYQGPCDKGQILVDHPQVRSNF